MVEKLRATMIVENRSRDPRLASSWGLSMLIEVGDRRILFDVGPDFHVLLGNAQMLGVDLRSIDAVFISHWHGDHAAALPQLLEYLGRDVPIYVPSPRGVGREIVARAGESVLIEDALSTGPMGFGIREHSLIVKVGDGIAVFVGCSHPGIDEILERATRVSGCDRVELVMGGLHIGGFEASYVANTFRAYGVRIVVPAHCTSDEAIEIIKRELSGAAQVLDPFVGLRVELG